MVVNRTRSTLVCSHSVLWSLFFVSSHDNHRYLLALRKLWVYLLEHSDEIFRVFKGFKIMAKRKFEKQTGFGRFMRCRWMVIMVMALHGIAHYLLLQVGLGEMYDAKVGKLALYDYSEVQYFGDMTYACMGNNFEL